ncbi:hypothetical protein T05_12862 [Trichinella murrelli]|uniref:Uncharacterized protein n=1 Tax=Trichinella murrelli TaxID=144512 RepID=A0A0V0TL82_9BILA|nr:hypothetical protein T05_12862 [Trichinella murrelli]
MSLCIAEIAESNHVYQVLSYALEAFQGFIDFYAPLLTVGSCTPLLKDDYSIQVYVRVPTHYHFEAF